ncbi:alpha/beta fold hydrolase [uncultured Roseobacter sp.]|uniref:alpha/beta fold hydrolase n=1 Tax=uncultured Roseobacter sp. TaxID=114847 RepID=UPI0026374D6D|nr:alpha/beta hydrolase [uncultured Roseobacter sp.]
MTEFDLKQSFESSCGKIAHDVFGEGPDVVLVHGTPVSSVIWHGVLKRLQHRYRFHVLDLPGYGCSAKFDGQEVRLRSFARVLAEWLASKELSRPALVGHDFGGATVMGAYLIEKADVAAICVSDGVVLSPWGTAFSRHVKENEEVFANVPEYIHHAVLEAHLKTAMSRTLDQAVLDRLTAPWLSESGQRAYYRQVGQYDYEYTEQLEQLYPTISVPTTVFWGEEDRWVDTSEGERFSQMLPDATLRILPDAGHFVMLDAPGLFSRYLDEWLSEFFHV